MSVDGQGSAAQQDHIDAPIPIRSDPADQHATFELTHDERKITVSKSPLQIQMHLNLALEASYQSGERPVSVEVVDSVLSRQIDDLEPTLTRHGYSIKDLVEQFDSKAGEIKALFNNKMLRAGLPI